MNALSLVCAMVLAILAHTTLAQNTQQDYVNSHNTARAAVGVGNVSWNNTVQQYAQTYANSRKGDCKLVHSGGPYGENIFWGPATSFTGVDAVNAWVDEKQYYDHSTNSCASGHVCGHYTQVVWRNSNQIGCARVVCDNNAGVFIICNYYPPGNYVGESPY
ncbi:pathogenesis-related protein PRB1-3-like [Carex rostrata]